MKKILIVLLGVIFFSGVYSQKLTPKEINKFENAEAILADISNNFMYDTIPFEERVAHIHDFIPKLVAILKEKNSFFYPFDGLETVSIITAPDSAFRIFTWQLKEPLGAHRYYGAMQMNASSLELIAFRDYSDTMEVHPQNKLSPENWYGGIYYNCILKEHNGQKTYTLFAYDEADFVSNRKFAEILRFNENGQPTFGAPIFVYKDSTENILKTESRFFREYAQNATCKLNYDEEMEIIIFDHLAPKKDAEKGAYFNYVPDGTYSGFKWKDGHWEFVEKIFHFSIDHPDNPPMPLPKHGDKNKNPVFGK